MKSRTSFLYLVTITLLSCSSGAFAEGGCPPGQYPQSGQGWQTCVAIPGSEQSQQTRKAPTWTARWGAIAVDGKKGILGSVDNVSGREEAETRAMDICKNKGRSPCILGVSYPNGCGAMAVGNGGFGFGSGATNSEAEAKSLAVCGSEGDKEPYYTGCSTPVAN